MRTKQDDVKMLEEAYDSIYKCKIIQENSSNFTSAGIPAKFANSFLKTFNVRHDAKIENISKPKAKDFEDGNFIINVLPNGDVIAAGFYGHRRLRNWYRLTMKNGEEPKEEYPENSREALKGMGVGGSFYRLRSDGWGITREDKPTPDELQKRASSEDALAGGTDSIYEYMNQTFMPKMKNQMDLMIDNIYSNLRKLDKNLDRRGRPRYYMNKNQQEEALDAALAIEKISENGFTRTTMENFLDAFGELHRGHMSWPNNEEELQNLLKNEPNARAKWAKMILQTAKTHHDLVQQMLEK